MRQTHRQTSQRNALRSNPFTENLNLTYIHYRNYGKLCKYRGVNPTTQWSQSINSEPEILVQLDYEVDGGPEFAADVPR